MGLWSVRCSATLVQCSVIMQRNEIHTEQEHRPILYCRLYENERLTSYLFVDALIIDLCLMSTLLHTLSSTNLLVFKTTVDLCFLKLWSAKQRGPNVSKNIDL